MKRLTARAVLNASRDALVRSAGVVATAAFTAALGAPFLVPLSANAADMNAVNNAASIASGVGAGSSVPALGVGAVLQTIVGLLVVIGLVFGCAWLARRFGLQPGNRGGLVKTIGGASLGGKERVAVVEIGDTWLVLGAAPGNVRLLHTMPAGSVPADGLAVTAPQNDGARAPLPGTFAQRFRDALKGEVGKRFNAQGGGDR
jgi:flagellar protein FliO/FliZ